MSLPKMIKLFWKSKAGDGKRGGERRKEKRKTWGKKGDSRKSWWACGSSSFVACAFPLEILPHTGRRRKNIRAIVMKPLKVIRRYKETENRILK